MDDQSQWTLTWEFKKGVLPDNLKPLLFSGSGLLGVPASVPGESPGTYMNGFFESAPITYGEKAYGYPSEQQIMVPLADVLDWEIQDRTSAREEILEFTEGIIELDMLRGIRTLRSTVKNAEGSVFRIKEETLCSLTHPNRLYSRITLRGWGRCRIVRRIKTPDRNGEESSDPRKTEALGDDIFRNSSCRLDGSVCLIEETTASSGISYACAAGMNAPGRIGGSGAGVFAEFYQDFDLSDSGEALWPIEAVFSSGTGAEGLISSALSELGLCIQKDCFENALKEQEEYLGEFWKKADIEVEKIPAYTRALRYASYGLLQSTGCDPDRSGSAKGLSSAGYNGHYFWDADIYIQGALNTMDTDRARSLVEYRIRHLKEARERAAELSEKGALYPWRTIDGRECSAFFPAGTAQFHINADIIWGMKSYLDNTGDRSLLVEGGAEMLFETARFWANFAVEVPGKGFCLHCVTGPDEYTACVDNNFYTNLMAREHLRYAEAVALEMKEEHPEFMEELSGRIGLTPDETDSWLDMAGRFYLPKMENSQVYKQDDSFLEKAPWDWENTPEENRPLLLFYHPLKIYRHRVMKQPDVLMAMFLEKQYFSRECIAANYAYYDPLTSGDSSLSSAVQSVAAALAGFQNDAEEHFKKNLFLDLEDLEGNTDNGIHLAAMGGARIALINGFADMERTAEGLSFNPSFPASWGRVSFSVLHRGVHLRVKYDPLEKSISFTADGGIKIRVDNEEISLTEGRE
ncbi:MAG: hypothetical protein PQJ50_17495, partial [Spirochaetales bacterium]|nr:hypothetical protein [Spirochaetales bacterium]